MHVEKYNSKVARCMNTWIDALPSLNLPLVGNPSNPELYLVVYLFMDAVN